MAWSDGGSACEYYRLRVPLDEVSRHQDIDYRIGSIFDTAFRPDVVIGQRVNQDGPTEFWRRLAAGELGYRPRLVYEIDDDLFEVPAHNPAASHFRDQRIHRNMRLSMARADVITVSTERLRDRVQLELNRNLHQVPPVVVIRNALPEIAYRTQRPVIDPPNIVTIGWAGSSSHVEDFFEVAEPLARYLRRDPAARYLTMGADFPDVRRRIADLQYDVSPWVANMNDYYASLDRFDVGIIPLRPSIFNQSKSDVKFLELAARWVPVIASNVGPYAEHRKLIDAVDQPHQWGLWLRAWARMIREGYDPELMSEIAYDYARSRHVEHAWRQWWEVLNGTA